MVRWRALLTSVVALVGLTLLPLFTTGVFGDDPVVSGPTIENGDFDGDGKINITDMICMVNFLYLSGPPPAPACEEGSTPTVENGDMDGDGKVNITDVICLGSWLYSGGPAPVEIECK